MNDHEIKSLFDEQRDANKRYVAALSGVLAGAIFGLFAVAGLAIYIVTR